MNAILKEKALRPNIFNDQGSLGGSCKTGDRKNREKTGRGRKKKYLVKIYRPSSNSDSTFLNQ